MAGSIVNTGPLQVNPGQTLQLVGGQVINTGTLTAAGGTVGLLAIAAPGTVRLSPTGTILGFDLADPALALALAPDHGPVAFNPLHLPQLLTGGSLDHATALVMDAAGRVFLQGSASGLALGAGSTAVAGTVSVARAEGVGGAIDLLGQQVVLAEARLDASGAAGGGAVRVGGEYQGQGALPRSQTTWIGETTTIAADALDQGDGGRVIVWADGLTGFGGQISAQGSPQGGNGGFVEVSGHRQLIFQGQVSTVAPLGHTGTLLLDPTDIEVVDSPSLTTALNGVDNLADADQGIPTQIHVGVLNTASNNIVLKATRDIFFNAALNLASGISLTAEANNRITLNQNITTQGGNVTLTADADNTGTANIRGENAAIVTNGGRVVLKASGEVLIGSIDTSRTDGQGGAITITHGTGSSSPFVVGRASSNGSVGRLTSGDYTFPTGSYGNSVSVSSKGFQSAPVNVGINPALNLVAAVSNGSTTLDPTDPPEKLEVNQLDAPQTLDSSPLDPRQSPSRPSATSPDSPGGAPLLRLENPGPDTFQLSSNPQMPGGPQGPAPASRTGGAEGPARPAGSPGPDQPDGPAKPQGPDAPPDLRQPQFPADRRLDQSPEGLKFDSIDRDFLADMNARFGATPIPGSRDSAANPRLTLSQSQQALQAIQDQTRVVPAVVYFRFSPSRVSTQADAPIAASIDPAMNRPIDSAIDAAINAAMDRPIDPAIDTAMNGPIDGSIYPPIDPLSSVVPTDPQEAAIAADRAATFAYLKQLQAKPEQHRSGPEHLLSQTPPIEQQDSDELEILMITASGQPLRRQIPGATRARVLLTLRRFRQELADPIKASQNQHQYRRPAQALYDWMIRPLEESLDAEGVANILFSLDAGLRSLPLAALYDGEQFLIEKYSIGLSPSLSLTDLRYRDVRDLDLLAMGASEFVDQNPLPTVPVEMGVISDLWPGNSKVFLNQAFTRANLIQQHRNGGYGLIHLATHADFQGGDLRNSYIQLYGSDRISLDQLRELGLDDPPVELLTLSACQTALGNAEAELGFAGLAVQAGVKTALASLWSVSDAATAALMTRFYSNLTQVPIKAEALRQAQLSMLRGEVVVEGNRLRGARGGGDVELPQASVAGLQGQALSHPFYWAPFTMVGSPW